MSQGKIVQIIGAVVDIEFPRTEVPKVYDALTVEGTAVTLEVQQQLGDGIVRAIALGSTDGLKRNLVATNTGRGIAVPVGAGTLGRIMDVLGSPIDEAGDIDGGSRRLARSRQKLEYAMQEARPEDRAAIADEIAMLDRFGVSAGALDSVYASKAMRASYHRTNRKRGRRH